MTITTGTIEELYGQQIKTLSKEEQIYLLKLIADGLAAEIEVESAGKHSLLEFEGVGAHNPVGMDAQKYVNQLRDEWDHRP